jgi:hypothetical protein
MIHEGWVYFPRGWVEKIYHHDTLRWVDFSRFFPRTQIGKSRLKDDDGTDNIIKYRVVLHWETHSSIIELKIISQDDCR